MGAMDISSCVASSLDSLTSTALQTEEHEVRRRGSSMQHRQDAHKEEAKTRTLKLLALGPDDIGADRLIQKVGIQSAANENTWAVTVRGEQPHFTLLPPHRSHCCLPIGHTVASPSVTLSPPHRSHCCLPIDHTNDCPHPHRSHCCLCPHPPPTL